MRSGLAACLLPLVAADQDAVALLQQTAKAHLQGLAANTAKELVKRASSDVRELESVMSSFTDEDKQHLITEFMQDGAVAKAFPEGVPIAIQKIVLDHMPDAVDEALLQKGGTTTKEKETLTTTPVPTPAVRESMKVYAVGYFKTDKCEGPPTSVASHLNVVNLCTCWRRGRGTILSEKGGQFVRQVFRDPDCNLPDGNGAPYDPVYATCTARGNNMWAKDTVINHEGCAVMEQSYANDDCTGAHEVEKIRLGGLCYANRRTGGSLRYTCTNSGKMKTEKFVAGDCSGAHSSPSQEEELMACKANRKLVKVTVA